MMTAAILTTLVLLSSSSLIYAQQEADSSTNKPPLTCKEILWAKIGDNGRMVTVSEPVFRRGETIYLVLRQVQTFQAGADGKHFMDIDMMVTDPDGALVLDQKNLLGEKGNQVLPDGIAASPHGIFQSSVKLAPGEYTLALTIHDRIAQVKARVSRKFQLRPGLGYRSTLFAKKDKTGQLKSVDDAVFQRGETVNFVMLDAGTFQLGPDGKHSFEIDMAVKGPTGDEVFNQKNMLAENGHITLENNVAETPYSMFHTSIQMDAGTYLLNFTIRDLVSGQSISVEQPFTLK